MVKSKGTTWVTEEQSRSPLTNTRRFKSREVETTLRLPCLSSSKGSPSSPSTLSLSRCYRAILGFVKDLISIELCPGIQPGGHRAKELPRGVGLHCRGRPQLGAVLPHLLILLLHLPHPLLAAATSRGDARRAHRLHRLLPRDARVGSGGGGEGEHTRQRPHIDRIATISELHTSGLRSLFM